MSLPGAQSPQSNPGISGWLPPLASSRAQKPGSFSSALVYIPPLGPVLGATDTGHRCTATSIASQSFPHSRPPPSGWNSPQRSSVQAGSPWKQAGAGAVHGQLSR